MYKFLLPIIVLLISLNVFSKQGRVFELENTTSDSDTLLYLYDDSTFIFVSYLNKTDDILYEDCIDNGVYVVIDSTMMLTGRNHNYEFAVDKRSLRLKGNKVINDVIFMYHSKISLDPLCD